MKINFFNNKKNFKKTKFYFDSSFYWVLIVCTVFILAVCSAVFGYYLFTEVNIDQVISIEGMDSKQTVKKERLEKALEYFSARETKSNDILNSPAPVVDPSL